MKLYNISALIICGALFVACSDNAYDPGEPNPGRPAEDYAVDKNVNINPSVTYQTIAGFRLPMPGSAHGSEETGPIRGRVSPTFFSVRK